MQFLEFLNFLFLFFKKLIIARLLFKTRRRFCNLHCNTDSFGDNFLGDLIFGLGKSINDETYALVLGVIDNDGLFSNLG